MTTYQPSVTASDLIGRANGSLSTAILCLEGDPGAPPPPALRPPKRH